jgi:hypothetical protein
MKPLRGFIKVKQPGQAHAGADWNKHVNKFQKRIGNKVIRRVSGDEIAWRVDDR